MAFIHPDIQCLLTLTSKKLTDHRTVVWNYQHKWNIVDKPKGDCIYNANGYDKMDVNRGDEDGETALHFASRFGNKKIIKILLTPLKSSSIVDVNIQNNQGWTALMCASSRGYEDIVRMLLTFTPLESSKMMCADPNIQDNQGWTALMGASWNSEGRSVRVLLDGGADPNIKDRDGKTALRCTFNKEIKGIFNEFQK